MKNPLDSLWIEKYRPRKLEQVVLNEDIRFKCLEWLEKKAIPHCLFYGPPGTGKTTVARILVRELGADVLELNASDERGIDMIRDKVKKFIMTTGFGTWKIVFMDEADGMTLQAQDTLRGLIEKFKETARFILTANYIDKLIEPLISRFSTGLIGFSDLPDKQVYSLLETVLKTEGIEFSSDDVFKIIDDSGGDLRRAIGMSQALVKGMKLVYKSLKDKVDVEELWLAAKDQQWSQVRNLINDGIDTTYVLEKFFDMVFEQSPQVAVEYVGEYLYKDAIVYDKKINLVCCLYQVAQFLK